MKSSRLGLILLFLISSFGLVACGTSASPMAPTSTSTSTPDPCAPEHIRAEVDKVNRFMREFDDASILASNTGRDRIGEPIAGLQKLRRDAEDQPVPQCLLQLKKYELDHMNAVISTLLAFMGGADPKLTDQGIAIARQKHDAYLLELAHLLGLTVVVPPTKTAQPGTSLSPDAASTTVTNPGPSTVNMRKTPTLEGGETLGLLNPGKTAAVLGRSPDHAWYLIEVPGQAGVTAWVYASLVTLSGPQEALPVVTPVP